MSRVSIADVAARAGVSRTTVSHAISGRRPVSAEVRERVQQAMDDLGYVPSHAAQSLIRGSTGLVGLIVPDIANEFFAELAKGVEDAAMQAGHNVLLGNTDFSAEREWFHLGTIRSRAVDGVVYAAGAPPAGSDTERILNGVPFVLVDEEIPEVAATTVVSNNGEAGALAAAHLAGLGHRRALVLGATSELLSSSRRVQAFRSRWRKPRMKSDVAFGGFTYQGGYEAVRNAIQTIHDDGITAIFAANDLMAMGAIQALREHGLGVPTDLSVVGCDDITAAHLVSPPLTTVRQDPQALGRRAVEELVDQMSGTASAPSVDAPNRIALPVELIVRESTAEPAHTPTKPRAK